MRYIILDDSQTMAPPDNFRDILRNEEFVAIGKLFLLVLAIIEGEDLNQLHSKIWPHELRLDLTSRSRVGGSSPSSFQANEDGFIPDRIGSINNAPPVEWHSTDADIASQSSCGAANALTDHQLFERYTVLQDDSSSEISIHLDDIMSESVETPEQITGNCDTSAFSDVVEGPERILDNVKETWYRFAPLPSPRTQQGYVEQDMDSSSPSSQVRARTPTRRRRVRSKRTYGPRNQAERVSLGSAGLSQDQTMHNQPELDQSSHSRSPSSCMSSPLDLPSNPGTPNTMSDISAVVGEESMNRITDGAIQTASPPTSSVRTEQNHIECNKGSTSLSSQTRKQNPFKDSPYLRAFNILTSRYGDHTEYALNPPEIILVIKAGDSFLREDAISFLESLYLGESRNGLWYQDHLSSPTGDRPLTERLLKSFQCAEILNQRSNVDPVRLRIARVLVYHHYEQLCVDSRRDPILSSRRSRGRDTASIATDKILEDIYCSQKDEANPQTWKQRRDLLQRHKKIGKRWSMLINCIGFGIFLICSPDLAAQINETAFSAGMIEAFLTYLTNVYPNGVRICKLLDSLAESLMKGGSVIEKWPKPDIVNTIKEYSQIEEKERNEFTDDWRLANVPPGFIKVL